MCVRLYILQPYDRSVCVFASTTCSMPISCWIRSHMYDYILEQISKDTLRQVKLWKFSVALLFSRRFLYIWDLYFENIFRLKVSLDFLYLFRIAFRLEFSLWSGPTFALLGCDSSIHRIKTHLQFHVLLKKIEITHSRMPTTEQQEKETADFIKLISIFSILKQK